MKHLFYLIYVLGYSGAVFMTGMFVGQILERRWAVVDEKSKEAANAREKTSDVELDPIGVNLSNATVGRTGKGK